MSDYEIDSTEDAPFPHRPISLNAQTPISIQKCLVRLVCDYNLSKVIWESFFEPLLPLDWSHKRKKWCLEFTMYMNGPKNFSDALFDDFQDMGRAGSNVEVTSAGEESAVFSKYNLRQKVHGSIGGVCIRLIDPIDADLGADIEISVGMTDLKVTNTITIVDADVASGLASILKQKNKNKNKNNVHETNVLRATSFVGNPSKTKIVTSPSSDIEEEVNEINEVKQEKEEEKNRKPSLSSSANLNQSSSDDDSDDDSEDDEDDDDSSDSEEEEMIPLSSTSSEVYGKHTPKEQKSVSTWKLVIFGDLRVTYLNVNSNGVEPLLETVRVACHYPSFADSLMELDPEPHGSALGVAVSAIRINLSAMALRLLTRWIKTNSDGDSHAKQITKNNSIHDSKICVLVDNQLGQFAQLYIGEAFDRLEVRRECMGNKNKNKAENFHVLLFVYSNFFVVFCPSFACSFACFFCLFLFIFYRFIFIFSCIFFLFFFSFFFFFFFFFFLSKYKHYTREEELANLLLTKNKIFTNDQKKKAAKKAGMKWKRKSRHSSAKENMTGDSAGRDENLGKQKKKKKKKCE